MTNDLSDVLGLSEASAGSESSDAAVRVSRLMVGDLRLRVISVPITPDYSGHGLTESELEVAEMAMRGLSDRDIASKREVSTRTVANQLRAIYGKVGVTNRSELTLKLIAGQEPPE